LNGLKGKAELGGNLCGTLALPAKRADLGSRGRPFHLGAAGWVAWAVREIVTVSSLGGLISSGFESTSAGAAVFTAGLCVVAANSAGPLATGFTIVSSFYCSSSALSADPLET
jgi:hypothetical protein